MGCQRITVKRKTSYLDIDESILSFVPNKCFVIYMLSCIQ